MIDRSTAIVTMLDRDRLYTFLEKYRDSKWITCRSMSPADGNEYTEQELDEGNGCQGCGELYHDDDVMQIVGVGPICFNCLYNIVALVLDGEIDIKD